MKAMVTRGAELDSSLLLSILTQPSAPFREGHVIRRIRQALDDAQVPYFADPVGNLVLGVASRKEYERLAREKSAEPLRVFIAHMDHPGFHGAAWSSSGALEVKWHGGSPTQHLEGAKVWLADAEGSLGEGSFVSVKMIPSGRAIDSGTVQVPVGLRQRRPDASKIFGGLAFRAPVWREGDLLYTKAADDLVGAFSIVSLALDLFGGGKSGSAKAPKRRKPATGKKPPFIGLLTRAEEVGFIGAIGHFELGWLKGARRPVLGVSLETSRTLPGAEIGKGPVVRLGDRMTVFDSSALRVFSLLAEKHLPGKHQRRVMDGGTCEATAATAYGIPCVGISVPLGNYHNQSFEGGPDSAGPLGPAPEFVHLDDTAGLLELCRALLTPKLPWAQPWAPKLKEFKKEYAAYKPLLRSGP
jgi:putative aminopeptidase FrvX